MMGEIYGNGRFFKILPKIPSTVHSELFSARMVVSESKLGVLGTPGHRPKIAPQPKADFWPIFGRNDGRNRWKPQIFQNPSRNTIYGAFRFVFRKNGGQGVKIWVCIHSGPPSNNHPSAKNRFLAHLWPKR
jgi:hypothetical protein